MASAPAAAMRWLDANWRIALTLALLAAAVVSGWAVWHRDAGDMPVVAGSGRPDYVLHDFELVALDDDGRESFTLRAPSMLREPGKYVVGLVIPGAAGILISLVLANHAIGGAIASPRYVYAMCGLTAFLAFLMVSTIKFRSFKDLRFNVRTVALVAFVVVSSAIVSLQTKPAFVLVWLLGCYVAIGLIEMVLELPRRRREAIEQRQDGDKP